MDWTAAAAVGQVVAAAFAIPSALFVGFQVRAARRASDLASLLAFHKDIAEQERRLLACETSEAKTAALIEFLNLLESYAACLHAKLLNSATRNLVREKLRDAIAMIEHHADTLAEWRKATSTPMAYAELRRFSSDNRWLIDRTKMQLAASLIEG